MSFNMYQATVPGILQTLNALSAVIDKAEADAAARKIDQTVLLGYRMAPDMFPLSRQFQLATVFATGMVARLAGVEVPKFDDAEKTLADMKARISKAIAFVQGIKPTALESSETRDITIPVGGQPKTFSGQDYVNQVALPQFYFHSTVAYTILRHCGVSIGKRDFLNRK
jgi:hypothetical protein